MRALWVAGMALAFILSIGGHVYSEDVARGPSQPGQKVRDGHNYRNDHNILIRKTSQPMPAPSVLEVSTSQDVRENANYVMELDGDRSLSIATDVERPRSGLLHYTVHLHLASSRDQFIDVMAPPGGLDPEVRDMTGDHVRNDLLLTPTLFCWPPTVLVNDGPDHFAVAISGAVPDSVSSRVEVTSGSDNAQGAAGLISSGFKVGGPDGSGERLCCFTQLAGAVPLPRFQSTGRSP